MMVLALVLPSSSASLGIVDPKTIEALDNSILDLLQRTSKGFFDWVLVSCFIVAIGILMEGPEILHELWPTLFIWFTWSSNERLHHFERAIKKIAFVGWFLIGIGVLGEGVFESLQKWAEDQSQTFSDTLLRDARFTASKAQRAADSAEASARQLGDDLEKAQQQLVQFDQRAGEISNRLDKASEKIGTVEETVEAQGPRWLLLDETKKEFIDSLKPFAGQRVTVVSCDNLELWSERFKLEQELSNLLGNAYPNGAGWTQRRVYGNAIHSKASKSALPIAPPMAFPMPCSLERR